MLPPVPPGFIPKQPFVHERIGAVAVYCSDGRYNEQFDEFLHEHLGLPRYDRLVIPGGPAALAGHFASLREEEPLADHLKFLIDAHELDRVILIAHHNCGYYRKRLMVGGSDARLRGQQATDLATAAARIHSISRSVEVSAYIAGLADERVIIEPVPL
jgi:hypothetical protein